MTLEIQNKQLNNNVSIETPQVEVSSTVETLPLVDQTSLPTNTDTLNGGNTISENIENKRSLNELDNSIASICQANNLPLNEMRDVLILISGKSVEELLDKNTTPQAEINKVVEKIKTAVQAVKEDLGDGELDINMIKKYVRLLDGEIPSGWDSIESFRNAQKRSSESLAERLKRMYGTDVKSLSKEQSANTLKAYFDNYFDELEAKGKTKEEIKSLQLTDFTKLLFNSSPEEYDIFRDAITYLVSNNRHKGYESILESFDTELQRTEFANETTQEQTKEWNTAPDQNGEVPTLDDIKSTTEIVLKYKDAEHVAEYHEASVLDAQEFYNEETLTVLEQIENDPTIIENILDKLVNGEDLSAEEKNILDIYQENKHHIGDNAGQVIGVANNEVIDEIEQKELLEIINYDAYEISEKAGEEFYRTILEEVAEYANSLSDANKSDFISLMENTIGENYTNVAQGNSTPMVKPEVASSGALYTEYTNNSSNSTNYDLSNTTVYSNNTFGYNNSVTKPTQTVSVEQFYQDSKNNEVVLTNNEVLIKPRNIEDIYEKHGIIEGFSESVKEFGLSASIKYAFDESKNAFVKSSAVKTFKTLDASLQVNTIKTLGEGLSLALDNAKNSTLLRLENITLRSFDATKKAREASEEIKKELS